MNWILEIIARNDISKIYSCKVKTHNLKYVKSYISWGGTYIRDYKCKACDVCIRAEFTRNRRCWVYKLSANNLAEFPYSCNVEIMKKACL